MFANVEKDGIISFCGMCMGVCLYITIALNFILAIVVSMHGINYVFTAAGFNVFAKFEIVIAFFGSVAASAYLAKIGIEKL